MLFPIDAPTFMGVVNLTPDSFSDGGSWTDPSAAIDQAEALAEAGAQIIDIGAESTRPGAAPVDTESEWRRLEPFLARWNANGLAKRGMRLSLDTSKADVARRGLQLGVDIINDVTALGDPGMAKVVAQATCGLILMHMRGEPRTMQSGNLHYDDVTAEVCRFLRERVDHAVASGIGRTKLAIDPGLGFGKTRTHNIALTMQLGRLSELGLPILYGASRKRFLGEILDKDPAARDPATAAVNTLAAAHGAHVFRVHNVEACRDAIRVGWACRGIPTR